MYVFVCVCVTGRVGGIKLRNSTSVEVASLLALWGLLQCNCTCVPLATQHPPAPPQSSPVSKPFHRLRPASTVWVAMLV